MKRRKRGFSLIDVMLALTASTVMLAGLAQLQGDLRQSQTSQTVAHQLTMVSEAARSYLNQNNLKLSNGIVPVGSAIEVPLVADSTWQGIGDLQTGGGLLSQSFQPVLPNGQVIHLLVRNIPVNGLVPQHLEAMIVTSGPPLNDRQVGLAMNAMEGNGGGIMARPIGGNTSVIQGSFGSWAEPISSWASAGVPLTYGHVAYTMNTIGSPISDYLNRYNTGNPEANRMHTDIDFNNNNANNVNTLDTQNIKNANGNSVHFESLLSGTSTENQTGYSVDNSVQFQDGAILCTNDRTGCGIQISDDGGFYDLNDSWITFVNPTGGGNAGLYLKGSNLAVDKDVSIQGSLGVNGKSAEGGYPSGMSPGIHSGNIYSEGEVATGYNGSIGSYLNANGDIYGSDWLTMGRGVHVQNGPLYTDSGDIYSNNGSVYTQNGNVFTNGGAVYTNRGDVFTNSGSLYTQQGNVYTRQGDVLSQNGNIYTQNGYVYASQYIAGQTLRSYYIANPGDSCNISISGYAVQWGDLAKDSSGNVLACANGIWTAQNSFTHINTYERLYSGTNNTGNAQFITARWHTDGHDSKHKWGSVEFLVNGVIVCEQVGTENDWASCSAMVLPGMTWSTTMSYYLPGSQMRGEWTTIVSSSNNN